jgi:3-hydroxyacyl-[acyl-carrier-protein] dehydratase
MILLNDFYTMAQFEPVPGAIRAKISINKDHSILEGHFPGLPIVPGVCMMQIIREIMEVMSGKDLKLTAADSMKFLSVINPAQNSEVEVAISYAEHTDHYVVNATLFAAAVTFFKLKATMTFS